VKRGDWGACGVGFPPSKSDNVAAARKAAQESLQAHWEIISAFVRLDRPADAKRLLANMGDALDALCDQLRRNG